MESAAERKARLKALRAARDDKVGGEKKLKFRNYLPQSEELAPAFEPPSRPWMRPSSAWRDRERGPRARLARGWRRDARAMLSRAHLHARLSRTGARLKILCEAGRESHDEPAARQP